MLGLAGDDLSAVGGHDLDCDERIDGEAVLADQPADAAAERQPGDADGARVAERRGQAVGGGRLGELDRGEARLCPGDPRVGVDAQAAHVGEVEDDATVDGAVARHAMAAAADRELELVVASEQDGPRHVACVGRADDCEWSGVQGRLVHPAGSLVLLVARQNQRPVRQPTSESRSIGSSMRGLRRILASKVLCSSWGLSKLGGCLRSNLRPGRGIDSRRQAGPGPDVRHEGHGHPSSNRSQDALRNWRDDR